ncbi:MAG TPA: NAD-dependent epimerase/dehydratase family protein [Azospirillaceae bacterium]|nr:NAD-dependent epimerase/dehydratase family protein [Azospirillaceae bacterium]
MSAPSSPLALVTGANGFVGRAVVDSLRARGWRVRAALRSGSVEGTERALVGDLTGPVDWPSHLDGVTAVVHLAARTHVMREDPGHAESAYRAINVEATRRLAEAAVEAGVRRFVHLSSVKALGERSNPGRPLTDRDEPAPEGPYGATKLEAERLLAALPLESVSLRPPLVYGPGVRANFLALMGLVARGVPLPFGALENRRSLIAVGNLADAVATAVTAAQATGTYLVTDGDAVSTPELVRAIARAMNRPARLLPVPPSLFRPLQALPGVGPAVSRLTGSLELDGSRFRDDFGWRPPLTMERALARTAAWYLSGRSRAGS